MIYYDEKQCDYYARKYFRSYVDDDEQYDGLHRFYSGRCSTTVRSIPVQDEIKIVDDGIYGLKYTKSNYRRPGPVVKNLIEIAGFYGGRKVGYYINVRQCDHGDEYDENLGQLNVDSARPAVKI